MSKSSTSIIVVGGAGRMGSRILSLARDSAEFHVVGAVDRAALSDHDPRFASVLPGDIGSLPRADVVIDFSGEEGTRAALGDALIHGSALLVGTTALSIAMVEALKDAAKKIPVLLASNTSLGIAVLADIAAQAARALGGRYECSIIESHHSKKKDAPSGTALTLAQAVRNAGHALENDQILAIRGGDVVGEHTIRFAGPGEYIELTHRATSRDLFARGALAAAAWLKHQNPGWYSIQHVIATP